MNNSHNQKHYSRQVRVFFQPFHIDSTKSIFVMNLFAVHLFALLAPHSIHLQCSLFISWLFSCVFAQSEISVVYIHLFIVASILA